MACHCRLVHFACQVDVFGQVPWTPTLAQWGKGERAVQCHAETRDAGVTTPRGVQWLEKLCDRNVVTWTATISALCKAGRWREALERYHQMLEDGVEPSRSTFLSLLKACGSLADLQEGRRIHAHVVRYRWISDVYVATTLVDMYAKCGSTAEARLVFDDLCQRDVVSWNAMLAGYAQQEQGQKAMQLYRQMRKEGISPNHRTFVSLLQACGCLADAEEGLLLDGQVIKTEALHTGKAVHHEAARIGCESDVFVCTTLLRVYARCGSIVDAEQVFNTLSHRNVVSWSAMLAAYAQQAQGERALELFGQMQEASVSPDHQTMVSVLQACSSLAEKEEVIPLDGQAIKVNSLQKGKAVHSDIAIRGYEGNVFLSNSLVSMYTKCGSVIDAETVFDRLSHRTVVSWTAMLAGYAQLDEGEKALKLFDEMQDAGISPDDRTFVSALQACGALAEKEDGLLLYGPPTKVESLWRGKHLHVAAAKRGYEGDVYVSNTLVSMYAKCGSLPDAEKVFLRLSQRKLESWNAMVAGYSQLGQGEKAFELYGQMLQLHVVPNHRTFASLLQACGCLAEKEEGTLVNGQTIKIKALGKGKEIHAEAVKTGCLSDLFVANSLVSMYAKCGRVTDGEVVFDTMPKRNAVSWSAMLGAYAQQGDGEKALELYAQMQEEGVSPDHWTFVCLLQACSSLAEKEESVIVGRQSIKVESLLQGKAIHAEAVRRGYEPDVFVGASLVNMYSKCGSVTDVENTFPTLLQPNVVSWNAMLAGYAQHGEGEKALQIYDRMRTDGISPDDRTFVNTIQACSSLARMEESTVLNGQSIKAESLRKGKQIHVEAAKLGYDRDVYVSNTILSMYAKCGSITDAENVFYSLSERTLVSWNAMLAGYAQQDQGEKALELYKQMQLEGVVPDDRTFASLLQACGSLAQKEEDAILDGQHLKVQTLRKGQAIHADVVHAGYQSDAFVCNALVTMYAKCGSVRDAQDVFHRLSHRDVVSWTAMIAGYTRQDEGEKAERLYHEMQAEGVEPDEVTLVCVLQACSSMGSLSKCIQIHREVVKREFENSPMVATALVHAYCQCGSMLHARNVFKTVPQGDVWAWTALIAGYARQGQLELSTRCFQEMCVAGVQPNGVTFLSLLCACSHAGKVDEGLEYFERMMTDYGIAPVMEHFASMIDLLGRAGLFKKVEDLLQHMPMEPNSAIWLSLLGACRNHGNVTLGRRAFDNLIRLQPKQGAGYVLMSNIYAHADMPDHAKQVEELRQKASAWKRPGQSWIEHDQEVHSFVVGDRKHQQHKRLYAYLEKLCRELQYQETGTVQDTIPRACGRLLS